MPDSLDVIRLDKWLWAARFYKTRQLAHEAIAGGKVQVSGQRCKPGKDIKIGTEININKNGYSWDITVCSIITQRRSAKDAALMYVESPESHAKRQQQIQDVKLQRELFGAIEASHKPNKKDRRLIHRFKLG
jgi:ribosome-associated heat shock protein Hsp15